MKFNIAKKTTTMKRLLILSFTIFFSSNVFASNDMEEYNLYLARAKRKISTGKYDEALEALLKARTKEPENPEIFNLMGDCNKQLRNFGESVKNYAYAKALTNRSENILLEGAVRLSKLF